MRKKRFSVWHLILAVVLTLAATAGSGFLIARALLGESGLSLVVGSYLVNQRFVGEYDERAVADATLAGMVESLGDRWSYYLTEEGYQAQNERRSNQYTGIGITVNYEREEGLLILEVTPGSPGETAGLLPGEIIAAVNGTSLAGEARYSGADLLVGEVGTEFSLTVLGKDGVTRTAPVVLQVLPRNPVSSRMLEQEIGYVKLSNFYTGSANYLAEAVTALQEAGATALIFDMRNNGGGYLSELTTMLDFLLPEGPIFRSRDRAGTETVTHSDVACVDLPMAVLVNSQTYSAAEFFAAELQEWGVAVIVGEPTSGKGYSQQTFALPHGGAMAISTGAYYTGKGTSLIGTGVTLDKEVYLTGEGDAQLVAAVALLTAEE